MTLCWSNDILLNALFLLLVFHLIVLCVVCFSNSHKYSFASHQSRLSLLRRNLVIAPCSCRCNRFCFTQNEEKLNHPIGHEVQKRTQKVLGSSQHWYIVTSPRQWESLRVCAKSWKMLLVSRTMRIRGMMFVFTPQNQPHYIKEELS